MTISRVQSRVSVLDSIYRSARRLGEVVVRKEKPSCDDYFYAFVGSESRKEQRSGNESEIIELDIPKQKIEIYLWATTESTIGSRASPAR